MNFICPHCKGVIEEKEQGFHCIKCNKKFKIEEGEIANFLETEFYWGELSQEEMKQINKKARDDGYKEALLETAKKHPEFAHYLLSSARTTWLHHCYTDKRKEKCLDIGSGWGSLAFLLSRYYDEVWSLEAVKERMEFQKIRKEQSGEGGVKLIRADMLKLPFPDNFFDLVVCNGVLEWAALKGTGNPKKIQKEFLKEIRRVLKPGGCVYVGIENRIGYQYWVGSPDHPGTRFTSLMPRKAADFVIKNFRKQEEKDIDDKKLVSGDMHNYRTYTYTIPGYRGLFEDSDFEDVDFYWCAPSYSFPIYSGRANGRDMNYFTSFIKNTVRSPLKSFFANIISGLGKHISIGSALTHFWAGYLIYAYKEEKIQTVEQEVISFFGIHEFFSIGSNSPDSPITYCYKDGRGQERILKYYLDAEEEKVKRNYETFCKENEVEVENSRINGFTIYSEPKFSGKYNSLNWKNNETVIEWLLEFQKKSTRPDIVPESELLELQEYIEGYGSKNLNNETLVDDFKQLYSLIKENEIKGCAAHGDFWAKNIFIEKNGKMKIIDWEYYNEQENPIFDFIFLQLANSTDNCGKSVFGRKFLENYRGNGKYSSLLKKAMEKYSKNSKIPMEALVLGIPYVAARIIRRHDIRLSGSTWNKNFLLFGEILEAWQKNKEDIRGFLLEGTSATEKK